MNSRSIYPSGQSIKMKDSITNAVCYTWKIDPGSVFSDTKKQPVAFARQLCMSLMYQLTSMSLIEIGKYFNRHYTTVIHAVKTVDKNSNDPEISKLIKETIKKIAQ